MLQSNNRARLFGVVIALTVALTAVFIHDAQAADPAISKKIKTNDNGQEILVITVTARDEAIHGLTITDASGSIQDIKVPSGWAAIASDEKIVFGADSPLTAGKSASFEIVTGKLDGELGVIFRGAKVMFGEKAAF